MLCKICDQEFDPETSDGRYLEFCGTCTYSRATELKSQRKSPFTQHSDDLVERAFGAVPYHMYRYYENLLRDPES